MHRPRYGERLAAPEPSAYVAERFRRALRDAAFDRCLVEFLYSSLRTPWIVLARAHIAWLLRQPDHTGRCLSYPEIAIAFRRRSHATFISSVRRHQRRIDSGASPASAAVTPAPHASHGDTTNGRDR